MVFQDSNRNVDYFSDAIYSQRPRWILYIRRSPNGKLYSSKYPDRTGHVITPAEAANQRRLAVISEMINRRKHAPVLSAQDQAAFLAQRNLPNAPRSYLFAICANNNPPGD